MRYDVIIVLAGGIRDDGSLAESVKARIHKAKDLFDKKMAPHILMTGRWSVYRETHIPPMTEAEAMYQYAIDIGIPEKAIFKEEQSNNTMNNAIFSHRSFLIPYKWKRVLIVTSDFHVSRARHIFNKVLGPGYEIVFESAITNPSMIKKLYQLIREKILLHLMLHRFS